LSEACGLGNAVRDKDLALKAAADVSPLSL